jgi:predicted MPP superfamily phosphohydrolase
MVYLLLLLPLLAGLLALIRYMRDIEPRRIETTFHEVIAKDLPPQLDGLTICQVSDLHITAHGRHEDAIAQAIRCVHADLYVLTGDMILFQEGIAAFFRWLDAMGDSLRPAVAVLGNAEHKSFVRGEEVVQGLQERGVPTLNNRVIQYPVRGVTLQIVGVDDPHTQHSDFAGAFASAKPDCWTLLLCHSPDGAADLCGRRADLMLSGHTHGGQIRLPLLGALMSNTKRVRGLVAGWYSGTELQRRAGSEVGSTRLYVSRGLGTSNFPYRLNCRPELPIFTLRCASPAQAPNGLPPPDTP